MLPSLQYIIENSFSITGMNRLTFSGLLNAIDGVTSTEARILFMTTNYLDRLDSALIRPGRVDYTQEIGHCTEYQIRTLFQNFYPEASSEEARVFGQEIGKHSRKLSPAKLQGILMRHKDHHDTEELVKDVQKCLE